MKDLLQQFRGKTVRLYTTSGVESYLGTVEEVTDQYLLLRSHFSQDATYINLQYIEAVKEEAQKA